MLKKFINFVKSEEPEDRIVVALSFLALVLVLIKFYLTGCVVVCMDWN